MRRQNLKPFQQLFRQDRRAGNDQCPVTCFADPQTGTFHFGAMQQRIGGEDIVIESAPRQCRADLVQRCGDTLIDPVSLRIVIECDIGQVFTVGKQMTDSLGITHQFAENPVLGIEAACVKRRSEVTHAIARRCEAPPFLRSSTSFRNTSGRHIE